MKTLQYAKMGASLSTSCHCNRHLLTMARISSNRSINGPLIERDNTLHQSQITFDNFVLLHLLYQRSYRHFYDASFGAAAAPATSSERSLRHRMSSGTAGRELVPKDGILSAA